MHIVFSLEKSRLVAEDRPSDVINNMPKSKRNALFETHLLETIDSVLNSESQIQSLDTMNQNLNPNSNKCPSLDQMISRKQTELDFLEDI